ncbi:MAG TPA: hypothetical protein VJT82_03800, partial [Pyrinomonadaceae bacterium]|nr:hypothetical protein [Pyrinomonadaceae bacterium]
MIKRTLAALAVLIILASIALIIFHRLRDKPTPTVAGWRATVTTLAGDGSPGTQDSQTATQARLQDPFGVAVDTRGNVYVADAGDSNRIRRIAPDGSAATLAGGAEGYSDGAGAAASFNTPSALAADANGNLYLADTSNNRIRKITPEGAVSTIAGDGTVGSRDGASASAQF